MNKPTNTFANTINPEIWVDAYGNSLFKYALFRLWDAELAEQKIQETFLAALQSRLCFQGLSTGRVWLISILKRKIFDHFREKDLHRHFRGTFLREGITDDALDCSKMKAIRLNSGFLDSLNAVCGLHNDKYTKFFTHKKFRFHSYSWNKGSIQLICQNIHGI
jgi:hypothetical protein